MPRPPRTFTVLALCALFVFLPACDSLPENIDLAQDAVIQARQVVDDAQADVDALEANPDVDPVELDEARVVLARAREALDVADATLTKISEDESPEAGVVEAIGSALTASTGQPWFYIAGGMLAGLIRERRRARIANANAVALARSVQPAIDAAPEATRQRIRDLQDGQPGIRDIVVEATD